jgi:hypothetical protein
MKMNMGSAAMSKTSSALHKGRKCSRESLKVSASVKREIKMAGSRIVSGDPPKIAKMGK